MRKKIISIILAVCFMFFSINTYAQNTYAQDEDSEKIQANAAAAGTYHATAVSMAFWGVALVAGIAVAAILIDSSHAHS
jgi:hypothetical protein